MISDVARLQNVLFFVGRVVLVWCAREFLGRRGLGIGLGLVFGCMSPVDMIFKYVCACCSCSRACSFTAKALT